MISPKHKGRRVRLEIKGFAQAGRASGREVVGLAGVDNKTRGIIIAGIISAIVR